MERQDSMNVASRVSECSQRVAMEQADSGGLGFLARGMVPIMPTPLLNLPCLTHLPR